MPTPVLDSPLASPSNPSPRPSALTFAPLILVPLVLALAVLLVRERQRTAALNVALEKQSRAFIAGNPVPPLPVRLAGGRATVLSTLCQPGKRFIVIFQQPGCLACTRLEETWKPLAANPRATVVLTDVRTGAIDATPVPAAPPGATMAAVSFRDFFTAYRVNGVPAVLVSDQACRVHSAGAGLTGSMAVLNGIVNQT